MTNPAACLHCPVHDLSLRGPIHLAPSYPDIKQTGLLLPMSLPPFDPKHHSLSLEKASQPFLTRTLAPCSINNSYIFLQYSASLPLHAFAYTLMSKRRWAGGGGLQPGGKRMHYLLAFSNRVFKKNTLRGATQAGTNFFQARLAFLCFFHYHFYSGDFSEDSQ